MLGLETNPRAARVAEAVLWIGYLQWHFRTRGTVNPVVAGVKARLFAAAVCRIQA